ncbi:MAG: hypothetical protein WC602_06220 [archaeon]
MQSQGLDPSWKKSVILAESKNDSIYQPIATGFLVLFQNHIFIVTNKHVAERRGLFFRFNSKSLSNPTIRLSIDTLLSFINLPWAVSSTSDVAAIPLIFYPSLSRYRDSIDVKFLGISLFKDWNYINEGDDVFILGFPLGVGVSARFSAVYRYGIIALKEIEGNYLIDSNIFPGNSGGPVFMKPSIFDYRKGALGEGTVGYLVGIDSAFLPYSDVAISLQTRRPRVIFEENSGLAVVYSTDAIVKLLSDYIKTHKPN